MHCRWSEWGQWSQCSCTCGPPGAGLRFRGRHIAREASHGGRECQGENKEELTCLHWKIYKKTLNPKPKRTPKTMPKNVIYYCPGENVFRVFEPQSYIAIQGRYLDE